MASPGRVLSDTSLPAAEMLREVRSRMTLGERLASAIGMCEDGFRLIEAGVRKREPALDEKSVFLKALELRLGPELVRKAYGR